MPDLLPISAGLLAGLPEGPAAFPCLWFGAPSVRVLELKARVRNSGVIPRDFQGRSALLLCRSERGVLSAGLALEPCVLPEVEPGALLPWARALLRAADPEVFEAAAKQRMLRDASGTAFSLWDFARKLFEGKPEKAARGGGAGLSLDRTHWMRALLEAPDAPLPQLLLALNEKNGVSSGERLFPLDACEWWQGPSPVHDVKHDGMALAPRTTLKPLIEKLLGQAALTPDPRLTDPGILSLEASVLDETEDYVVIFKPSGLLSVPGTLGLPDAMTQTATRIGCPLTPVHRLDMDTSGLLVYTKHLEATRSLMAAFREGRVRKIYQAVLEGVPATQNGHVSLPITTQPLDRLRQCAAIGGRPSETLWKMISEGMFRGKPAALVELTPLTGRTHQLRLHAAHPLGIGIPIAGDPFYGRAGIENEKPETPLCLHAGLLDFPDPSTGVRRCCRHPAPFVLESQKP